MSDPQRILNVAARIRRERLAGIRLKIMLPILLLFLPGMAWGFSDPNIVLPGGHRPDTAMEVLFYASLGVVFGATMCAVLMAFDGVSKDRASGMLEVRLAQPMPRRHQATALILRADTAPKDRPRRRRLERGSDGLKCAEPRLARRLIRRA